MSDAPDGQLTAMLRRLRDGDSDAVGAVLPFVYDHLRAIAASQLRGQHGHTLQPTALVHEAFLRLVGNADQDWQSRGHFLAVLTKAMRQILVDHARRRTRQKRGGGEARTPPSAITDNEPPDLAAPGPDGELDLLALHQALERLAALDGRVARIAELKVFAGSSNEEIAEVLATSLRTVEREWRRAKAWLERELAG